MTDNYETAAQNVADAMAAVYENKQANKKNSISGDFSTDNASYPTVKAVKTEFGTKVTSWSATTVDTNYPSEKLVKDSLDGKANSTHNHTKSQITDFPTTMTPSSHTHGNLTNDGKVGTASGKIITTTTGGAIQASDSITKSMISDFPTSMTPAAHNQASTTITEASALSNIGTSANATQSTINSAINTAIGTIQGINAIQVVTTKPTASASTMNKLYIVSEDNKVNVYYTTQSGSSYSWHKMDTDILDELSISWNDIQNKPSSFTPSSHTHGNLTNDGKVGSTSGKPLITTTGGAVTTGSFGTSSGQFAEGNHTHNYTTTANVQSEISSFANALSEAINPSS